MSVEGRYRCPGSAPVSSAEEALPQVSVAEARDRRLVTRALIARRYDRVSVNEWTQAPGFPAAVGRLRRDSGTPGKPARLYRAAEVEAWVASRH